MSVSRPRFESWPFLPHCKQTSQQNGPAAPRKAARVAECGAAHSGDCQQAHLTSLCGSKRQIREKRDSCVGAPSSAGVMGALLASEERGGTGPSRSSASEPWPYQNLCTWQTQHTSLPFGDRWTCHFPLAQSFPKFGSWDNFISDTK